MLSRLLLAALLAMTSSTSDPGPQPDAEAAQPSVIEPIDARRAPPVRLLRVSSGQRHVLRLFDDDGHLRTAALAELRTLLSDRRTKIDHPIHWRLATLLVAIAAHFPEAEIEVVSGYRHVNRHHKRSRHTRGHALDFRIRGVENRELFELLRRSFADIGVGYYPNSTFVHLDVRPQSTIWVDYSGPGQTPCYARRPEADLRSGRAESQSYANAIAGGCRKPASSAD